MRVPLVNLDGFADLYGLAVRGDGDYPIHLLAMCETLELVPSGRVCRGRGNGPERRDAGHGARPVDHEDAPDGVWLVSK